MIHWVLEDVLGPIRHSSPGTEGGSMVFTLQFTKLMEMRTLPPSLTSVAFTESSTLGTAFWANTRQGLTINIIQTNGARALEEMRIAFMSPIFLNVLRLSSSLFAQLSCPQFRLNFSLLAL